MIKSYYQMKIFIFLTLPILLITISNINCFSQTNIEQSDFKKLTFIYKKIHKLEILADVYKIDTINKRPVVIYFHGGGFIFSNREQGLQHLLRDKFLKEKFVVVSADYRLAPETKLDSILKDAEDLYKWVLNEGPKLFNADTSRVIVAGASAGGVLAMHAALNKHKPKAVILISSPTDYTNLNWEPGNTLLLKAASEYSVVSKNELSYGDYDTRMSLYSFLKNNNLWLYEVIGFDLTKDTERFKHILPFNNLKTDFPPTLILHAKNDDDVPFSQAEILDTAMNKLMIKHELNAVQEGHSSELIKNNPDATIQIISFINEQISILKE